MPTTAYPIDRPAPGQRESEIGVRPVDSLLRCVSSGYLSDGCSCQATIPSSVVTAAWARERELLGAHQDRFFRFAWRGGVWFSFGLRDGDVRGVYCPMHSAGRAERSFVQNVSVAS